MKFIKAIGKIFKKRPLVVVVRLEGVIGAVSRFGSGGIDDSNTQKLLEKAFEFEKAKAIVLKINSPGGSPTQSSLIADRIIKLSKSKNIPVLAFCEDVAASGGYWLACSAEEIYSDINSIIGSIGVISAGFGFSELISRYGIERRIYTAGEEKSMLDPFQPEKATDIKRLKLIQKAIFENFKGFVTERRGKKVSGKKIFNGEVWEAERAKDLGLIDGVGSMEIILEDKFGEDIKYKYLSKKKTFFSRFSSSVSDELVAKIVQNNYFSKFGL
jgi:serine protease SohB